MENNEFIVISSPNYSGFIQGRLNGYLNSEVYRTHVLDAMSPYAWCKVAKGLDFDVGFCGSFGGFGLLVEGDRKWRWDQRLLLRFIWRLSPIFAKSLPNNDSYSLFYGLIGKRRKPA